MATKTATPNWLKYAAGPGLTLFVVAAIETGRLTGWILPIPFLLLFVSVVIAGGAGGLVSGLASGAIGAGLIVHAHYAGFGPQTLTGGTMQTGLGCGLFIATGLLIGRIRDQRDNLLRQVREHEADLERTVAERTAQLRESEEILRQIAESIPSVLWLADPADRRVIYVNTAYETIWGRSRESLYADSRSFLDAVHPDDSERIAAGMRERWNHEYDAEYRVVRPDGSVRSVRDRSFPITDAQGNISRVVGIVADITEARRRLEAERQVQKMESLGTLAGGVAHELNNLLLPIQGLTELVMERLADDDEAARNLALVLQSSEHARNLVDKILSFSRQEETAHELFDVYAMVAAESPLIRAAVPGHISLRFSPEEMTGHRPLPVLGDPTNFRLVLMNLVSNAVFAMAERGGTLTVAVARTELGASPVTGGSGSGVAPGSYARLSVSDTGAGIEPDLMGRIFDPFFTTKPVGEGTGLGLAMVHGIVTAQGGAVDVSSTPENGTRFDILLPIACSDAAATGKEGAAMAGNAAAVS